MDTVASGDKVWVKSTGTYSDEHSSHDAVARIMTSIGNTVPPVVFEGYESSTGDNGKATVDASINNLASCLNDNWGSTNTSSQYVFRNFRFYGGTSTVADLYHCYQPSFYNCSFESGGLYGVSIGAYGNVINCEIFNNTDYGVYVRYTTVAGCKIYNNSGGGIQQAVYLRLYNNLVYGIPSGKYGIVGGYCKIVNNTVAGVSGKGGTGIYTYQNAICMNNIITRFSTGLLSASGQDTITIYRNNLLYDNTTNYSNTRSDAGDTDITSDPKFLDLTNDDYRLQPDSPAITAGVDGGELTSSGTSHIDIGCYQRSHWNRSEWK
jgi:hypothetical protein